MHNILPNLYQGGRPEPGQLDRRWIVVCLDDTPVDTGAILTLHAPIADSGWPGNDWLDAMVAAITAWVPYHPVYIHCREGVSRSVMLCAAVLMDTWCWCVDAALEHIAKANPKLNPRLSFIEGLKAWQRE